MSPFVSKAQQRYFHSHQKELEAQGVSVAQWDKETGNTRLPERIGKTKHQKNLAKLKRGMQGKKR